MKHCLQIGVLSRLTLVLLGALQLPGAAAQQVDLGTAAQYGAFILGDASDLARVDGRLAVGRDFASQALELGAALDQGAQPALVVRRSVTGYASGAIRAGAGHIGHGVVGVGMAGVGPGIDLRRADIGLDFDAEATWLNMLSARLGAMPASGAVHAQSGVLTLRGSGAELEVFELSALQAGAGAALQLANVAPGAWLVINVRADRQRRLGLRLNQEALRAHHARVLFNFPDTDALRLDGARVWGSVLAPFAQAGGDGGVIEGTLVAATWKGRSEAGRSAFEAGPP